MTFRNINKFCYLVLITIIFGFNPLIWATEEKVEEENKALVAVPAVSSFESDIPEEIQKYVLYWVPDEIFTPLSSTSKTINRLVQEFLFEKQHKRNKKPLLLELITPYNKWVNYYLGYQQLDTFIEILGNIEIIATNSSNNINSDDQMEHLEQFKEYSANILEEKSLQILNLDSFFHHQEQYFIENIICYLFAEFGTECSRKNNCIDIENKAQGNIQKIENFFIDVLPERFSKSIELRQKKALFREYNVLFRQNNAFCLMQNQLADNTIINYININLFIRRLENTYQLYPSDLNFYISLILEDFLNTVFKNPDQLFVLQHTKKLPFIPFAKIGLFIAYDSLDKATEYFKYCNLDQIFVAHFDKSEILKTCGYISVIQEQKQPGDSNQDDQRSKKFFQAAANLGCEDSKNILDQFYQSKSSSDSEITVDHMEIIKNYGCTIIRPNIPIIYGIPLITASEKTLFKQNLWSFWYHLELDDDKFYTSVQDELQKMGQN